MEDADYAVIAYGGAAFGNAREAVDVARERGIRAGAIRLRVWRPFPADRLLKQLAGVKAFAVIDRAIAFGSPGGGPAFIDVATALYMGGMDVPGLSVIHGIGQRSMYVEDFVKIFEMLKDGERNKVVYMGLRL
jgi:pyruvate ferredoxin oxidoreductase, alpha subunit (EC 1.2.7.1)